MRGFFAILGAFGLLISQSNAKAQATQGKWNAPVQGTSVLEQPQFSRPADYFGYIRMEGMQYLTSLPDKPELTYSQLLSARFSILKETNWMDAALDISGGTFFTVQQSHYVVHEAYVATPQRKSLAGFLGRKKIPWNDLDQRWQLGLWQPKFAIDTLRPEDQGLTGFFANYKSSQFEFVAFATPIFIPNMGPDIREEGGSLVSDSRWYRVPGRDYEFGRRINTITYDLDIPAYEKLVLNGGAAAMVRFGNINSGPWSRVSYGYLPVNELLLKRKNFKSVSADTVDVTVSPDLTYHTLVSADFGYNFSDQSRLVASYLMDNPTEKTPDEDWSIQKLESLQAYSLAMDIAVQDLLPFPISMVLEYLKVTGGQIQDILANGQADDFTMFNHRLNFTNSLAFKVEGEVARLYRRPLVTRFRYLYDYDQRGSLLSTEVLFYPQREWALVVGGDVLGVRDENYDKSSFLNQYRANDRVYGGMSYVF